MAVVMVTKAPRRETKYASGPKGWVVGAAVQRPPGPRGGRPSQGAVRRGLLSF